MTEDGSIRSDHNYRQYEIMLAIINDFFAERVGLSVVVRQLKALFWALDSPDEKWSDDFLSEWGALETVNALNADRAEQGQSESEVVSERFIKEALEKIRHMVLTALSHGVTGWPSRLTP